MPIHLPPISRRQFLARSTIALTAFGMGQSGWSKTAKRDPDTWALLSDTHISADPQAIARDINMANHLSHIVQELISAKTKIGGVIIDGDCALQRGQPGDYATFSEILKPVRAAQIPVHLALGNHDDRANFYSGLVANKSEQGAKFSKHISLIETSRANWFLLDSLDKTAVTPGLIGDEQRQWLADALDFNTKKPAIIVAHHQIDNSHGSMIDGDQLLEIMRPRKQVKAYIFGHTHRWNVSQDASGIHLVNLPTTAYIFREEEPQGWVSAKVERRGIRLKLNCINRTHKKHGEEIQLKWRDS